MESIIKKIYFKKLGYVERLPEDKEYQEAYDAHTKAYKALKEGLSKEQKSLLADLCACEGDLESVSEFLSFENGFRAGVLLGMELCKKSE